MLALLVRWVIIVAHKAATMCCELSGLLETDLTGLTGTLA
jgi:hypothetical protein